LRALGSCYGALPAHDGLWESAEDTAGDPLARLAIVPMVLEARGLDVTPEMIARLRAAGDQVSARILSRIADDEIRHVAAGVRWFEARCLEEGKGPAKTWQALVRRHFKGVIKPPFNHSSRTAAGLPQDFYVPLAPRHEPQQKGAAVAGGAILKTA
jgi:uncharacterized ferritin-like protein (DUF455 family)